MYNLRFIKKIIFLYRFLKHYWDLQFEMHAVNYVNV